MGITLKEYAMGREEMAPQEWAAAVPNAEKLLKAVNALLSDLFPEHTFAVSSGFRPSMVNAKIKGAAKKSGHLTGHAIDIKDADGFLKKNLTPATNPDHADRLRALGLFLEDPNATPTWCHLDIKERKDRPSRIFKIA